MRSRLDAAAAVMAVGVLVFTIAAVVLVVAQ